MKLTDYLADQLIPLFLYVISCVGTAFFLWIMEIDWSIITIVAGFLMILYSSIFFYDWFRKKSFYDVLAEQSSTSLHVSLDQLRRPSFTEGQMIYRLLQSHQQHLNLLELKELKSREERKDFMTSWVHEMKTPITTIRLLSENNRNTLMENVEEEVNTLEHYIEQALYLSQVEEAEKDFILHETELKPLVRQSLNQQIKPLLLKGFKINWGLIEGVVLLDRKRILFILNQLLVNSIKYCSTAKKPELTFESHALGEKIVLTISDNGIGIPAKDLPRIFDRGFTGENGRRHPNATGVGLYLCKELSKKMGMDIRVESTEGKRTTFFLIMQKANITSL